MRSATLARPPALAAGPNDWHIASEQRRADSIKILHHQLHAFDGTGCVRLIHFYWANRKEPGP